MKKRRETKEKKFFPNPSRQDVVKSSKADTEIVSNSFFIVYLQQNKKTREPRERNVRLKL
jgi:hypothetical protein